MNFLTTADVDKSWDRFVESHPRATVAHLSAWGQIAREVYGHEPVYLRAEEDGEIRGVLPLVLISGRLFGRRLVSMPFLDYGGVLAGGEQGLAAAWTGPETLDEFYTVYAINMRDLGSPPHSRGFFRAMLKALPGTARVLLVRDKDGRAVGAAVCLFFRDTIMVPWVSSLRE